MYAILKTNSKRLIIAKNLKDLKLRLGKNSKIQINEDEEGFWIFGERGVRRILKPQDDKTILKSLKEQIPPQTLKNTKKVKELDEVEEILLKELKTNLLYKAKTKDPLFGMMPVYALRPENIFINGNTGVGKTTTVIKFIFSLCQIHLLSCSEIKYFSAYHLTPEFLKELEELIERQKEGEEKVGLLIIDDLNVEIIRNQPQMSSKFLYYIYEIEAPIKITISNYPFKELIKATETAGERWISSRLIALREKKIDLSNFTSAKDKRLLKAKQK